MKISVIQNVYLKNPHIPSVMLRNLTSLKESNINYEYIIFNDNGDPSIKDDIDSFLEKYDLKDNNLKEHVDRIKYIYSNINYGKKMCTGGYIGAIPYISGEIIHQIGQDDIFTVAFYKKVYEKFISNKDIYYVTVNAFRIDEELNILSIMNHRDFIMDCSKPLEIFKMWFGIYPPNYEVTTANNGFLAPGTLYKKELHDLIGTFDLENFKGAADFEYWSRILFNEFKGIYINEPLWFYMVSRYSAGNEIIDGKPNRGYWQQFYIQKIKEKYSNLVKNNKNKFIGI